MNRYDRENGWFILNDTSFQVKAFKILGYPFIFFAAIIFLCIILKLIEGELHIGLMISAVVFGLSGFQLLKFRFIRYLSPDGKMLRIQRHTLWHRVENYPLAPFDQVVLENRIAPSSDVPSSSVVAVLLNTRYVDTCLSEDSEYLPSRLKAEQLAKHFHIPVVDKTETPEKIMSPEELDHIIELQAFTDLPALPDNTSVRCINTDQSLKVLLPRRHKFPVIWLLQPIVLILGAAYIEQQASFQLSQYYLDLVVAIVVIAQLSRITCDVLHTPWISIAGDQLTIKSKPFTRPERITLDNKIAEATITGSRRVIVRSAGFRLELPVYSSEKDAEYIQKLILWACSRVNQERK